MTSRGDGTRAEGEWLERCPECGETITLHQDWIKRGGVLRHRACDEPGGRKRDLMGTDETPNTAVHDLRIESGGFRMEAFVYGYCPCGWSTDMKLPGPTWDENDIKQAFHRHLQTTGGRSAI